MALSRAKVCFVLFEIRVAIASQVPARPYFHCSVASHPTFGHQLQRFKSHHKASFLHPSNVVNLSSPASSRLVVARSPGAALAAQGAAAAGASGSASGTSSSAALTSPSSIAITVSGPAAAPSSSLSSSGSGPLAAPLAADVAAGAVDNAGLSSHPTSSHRRRRTRTASTLHPEQAHRASKRQRTTCLPGDTRRDSSINAMQPGSSSSSGSSSSRRNAGSSNGVHDRLSNGVSSNGAAPASSALAANGSAENGNAVAGPSSKRFEPLYPGSHIDREELVRLTLQCLSDAGYPQAAEALSRESGFRLESPTITAFRNGVLEGKWESVSRLLQDGYIVDGDALSTVRFLISEQKFLEHLEARDTKRALSVLRNELAPLNHNPERLHELSSFMMCAGPQDLRERSGWSGSGPESRHSLLLALQEHIPSPVMIPQRRLETLLEQAKQHQRQSCRYHAYDQPISLYADHVCDRHVFPTITTHILGGHTDEVWRVEFSHNGRYLATASQDGTVMLWKVEDGFTLSHTLHAAEHSENITSLAWSPDDTKILLGVENAIKIFDVTSGACTLNVIKHEYCAVGGVAWLPNSHSFFSGGLDMRVLCWDGDGHITYAFSTAPYRIVDIAVSPDGSRLVCLGEASHVHRGQRQDETGRATANGVSSTSQSMFEVKDRRIIIFDLNARRQERSIQHPTALTSVSFAPDSSRFALINQAPDEVIIYDIIEGSVAKRLKGQHQSLNMIRSCFGGASNTFVISGSEDATIYVWHRDNVEPLERLTGHGNGCVNDVAWNPASPGMFASAGDDKTVRIWQATASQSPA